MQDNVSCSLWVWLREALQVEYPLPTDWDDKAASWKSIAEAGQYLQELATWQGMYSCNFLGADMESFTPHMKTCILEGGQFALKGLIISLLGAVMGQNSGGYYSITRTAW